MLRVHGFIEPTPVRKEAGEFMVASRRLWRLAAVTCLTDVRERKRSILFDLFGEQAGGAGSCTRTCPLLSPFDKGRKPLRRVRFCIIPGSRSNK
jgi:hypothetical protein